MSQAPYVQDWTEVLKEIQFDQVVCHFHSASYWPNYKYFGNLWCMRTLWDGYYKDHAAHKPSGSRTYLWQAWKTEREWNRARRKCNGQTDIIPPFPCHALQRKQTEQEDLPSFFLRFPPSLLHKCLIIFFRLVPLWEPWTALLQQNISLLYTDLDLEGHVCFKNIPHLLIALSLLFQPTEKAPKRWWF